MGSNIERSVSHILWLVVTVWWFWRVFLGLFGKFGLITPNGEKHNDDDDDLVERLIFQSTNKFHSFTL